MSYPAPFITCETCQTSFHFSRCERSEDDNAPELPGQPCADPTCEVWICAASCQHHHSFVCHCCDQLFCLAHKTELPDGDRPLKLCTSCAAEMALADLEELEPECTCQFSGDQADASDCEFHNPMSPWNRRLRALKATVESCELRGVG